MQISGSEELLCANFTEDLIARSSAYYPAHGQASFTAACQSWPRPSRRETLGLKLFQQSPHSQIEPPDPVLAYPWCLLSSNAWKVNDFKLIVQGCCQAGDYDSLVQAHCQSQNHVGQDKVMKVVPEICHITFLLSIIFLKADDIISPSIIAVVIFGRLCQSSHVAQVLASAHESLDVRVCLSGTTLGHGIEYKLRVSQTWVHYMCCFVPSHSHVVPYCPKSQPINFPRQKKMTSTT